ncbi:MAG: electron transfer flavoprotein subunit alpha/FixB family protein [Candidatus Promineifilaceae bacterium]|nr:electron transfer flavoprotein subunit alpha/FixB family protein [Candidatus Promineifilaceae bacterium]
MILAFCEHDHGALDDVSAETLTLGRALAAQLNLPLEAALIGPADGATETLGAHGVAHVHLVDHERFTDYAPEAWARSLVQLAESRQAQVIMGPGTERGNEILAHAGAVNGQPLAANCTAVTSGESAFQVTRIRWGGSLLEEAQLEGDPKLLTVAPHTVAAAPALSPTQPETTTFNPTLGEKAFRVRITDRIEAEGDKVSLAEAAVVVGGGRGVGSAEGFDVLEELADLLNGAVGGSRVATNLGWRPHADQIGQTGTRIGPDLYIACGISGAVQHMVGAKGSKHILVINKDREAPIMGKADYAIIGDLHEILPALIEEVKKAKAG